MKLVKMSLAAAVLMGASAYAIDNVKVNGDAKVYYETSNEGTNNDLFKQGTSSADTALRIGATMDLLKNVSAGVTGYAVSTLGLENNLVANTWTGAHYNNGTAGVDDAAWIGELWLAGTAGKTTLKAGRMELDTPLAYSEKWSIVPNTFEAAVVVNQDIPQTTLVAGWVGKGNGVNALTTNSTVRSLTSAAADNSSAVGIDGYLSLNAKFTTFMKEGAYTIGAINNSFKPLTAQAWYYNIGSVADAYWLQADIDCSLIPGVKIGAQYSDMDTKGGLSTVGDSSGYAFKLGYEGIQNLKLSAAYSSTDEKGVLRIANVGTDNLDNAESKLYTETFWNRGWVGAAGADAWNLKASYDIKDVAKFCVSYTDVEVGVTNATNRAIKNLDNDDLNELAVAVSKSFGALDTKLAYISTDSTDVNSGKRYDTLNVYLTLNF